MESSNVDVARAMIAIVFHGMLRLIIAALIRWASFEELFHPRRDSEDSESFGILTAGVS